MDYGFVHGGGVLDGWKVAFVGVKSKILSILYTSNEVKKLFCFVQNFWGFWALYLTCLMVKY